MKWMLAAVLAALPAPAAADAFPVFKIAVEETAAYRVRFEDLAAAGLAGPLPSIGMGLACAGAPVPLWVEDGGDGTFGPGDHLEFLGRHLAGEVSYLSEDARYNVYVLRFDAAGPARMSAGPPPATAAAAPALPPRELRSERHLERDLLILRLPPPPDGRRDELWYWARLTHDQREPFTQRLDLRDLEPAPGRTAELRLQLRGWSQPREKADPADPDHRVDVALNGVAVANAAWNGTALHRVDIPVPAERLTRGDNTLELRVPRRAANAGGTPLIDVVMLNWIEVSYPRSAWIGDGQARLELAPSGQGGLRLESAPGGRDLLVFGESGWRGVARRVGGAGDGGVRWAAAPPPGERAVIVTPGARLASPAAVVPDRPSRLADAANRADYIVIAHPTLLAAVRPLAELHRARGLAVAVVDVEDVYDEFGHGIAGPRALRSFLAFARSRWAPPAPRFVLLVGDASWDAKNTQAEDANYADWTYQPGESAGFAKNGSTLYASGAGLNHRNLIPTWNHATGEGHSASDNWFADVEGDDGLPDLAIGRLPVVEPAEVAAIVEKTRRYVAAPEPGPWRRDVLLIANDDPGFQGASDGLAGWIATQGYAAGKIYPAAGERSNERNTRRLLDAFGRGASIVHFFGHGGRYIWRTGPPDLQKNHDLFTLDDLDRLRPTGRLPVVLSMTCYSAPFDHPNADSIGEKLLRLPGRGAVAVLAASWRNAPTVVWSQVVIEELARPGATLGEAVLRAKRRIPDPYFIATYNLLGDPAAPVALPPGAVALSPPESGAGRIEVAGEVKVEGFTGQVAIDLIDERGEVVRGETLDLAAPRFAAGFSLSADELLAVRGVRAYAWNAACGLDAIGGVEFTGNAAALAARAAAAGPTP
ncbi:MAG TPA: C25 family cysteine peptidase [Thermoanaerobaculia bacterium]